MPVRGRSSRRHERSSWRRERALVRQRLATPPPDYLSGPFLDPDDGDPSGGDGAAGTPGLRSGKRRTRLRLALAALPLAVAVVLFALTGPGSGPSPAPDHDTAVAEDSGMTDVRPDPTRVPGSADALLPPRAQDTAVDAGMLAGQDSVRAAPGRGADGNGVDGDGAEPGNADGNGVDGDGAEGDGADAPAVPPAPSGHRPVALRIADPAALSLVATGDRVDIVGMDGNVLAEDLEVLRDRSSGAGSVLVLAVPDGAGAALAAAALSREVTVILSAGSGVHESVP
ncbi:MAG: hypothetical protein QJR09_02725 [Micrococcus sp.]|nr:hypothetical protein [Micrococcus sp.]